MRNGVSEIRKGTSMPKTESETHYDFFSNAAALEAGFTHRFWLQAYLQFQREAESDISIPAFVRYAVARTVRIPFRHEHIDVLVRCQPDPREYRIFRLTAFPAEDERRALQVSRAYRYLIEGRAILGEAALLDTGRQW